jgi:hypothetical protein
VTKYHLAERPAEIVAATIGRAVDLAQPALR